MILFFVSFFSIGHKGVTFQFNENGSLELSALTSNNRIFPISINNICDNFSTTTSTITADNSLGANLIGRRSKIASLGFTYNKIDSKITYPLCSKRFKQSEIEHLINNGYLINFNLNSFMLHSFDGIGLKFGHNTTIYNKIVILIHYEPTKVKDVYEVTGVSGYPDSDLVNLTNIDYKLPIDFKYSVKFTTNKSDYSDIVKSTTNKASLSVFYIILLIVGILLFILFSSRAEKSTLLYDEYEDSTWYYLRGDMFRVPKKFSLLISIVSLGFQVFSAAIFASFYRYETESDLLNRFLFNILILSPFCGYFAVRVLKYAEGNEWRSLIVMNSLSLPIIIIIFLCITIPLNFFYRSSCLLTLDNIGKIAVGIFLHIILSFLGSIISFQISVPPPPFKLNLIPKQIPRQPYWLRGGIIKYSIQGLFVSFFAYTYFQLVLQMMYDSSQIDVHKVIGFEMCVVLFLSSFLASVFFIYLSILKGNFNWWWDSFVGPSFCGIYYIIISISLNKNKLSLFLDSASIIMYIVQHAMIGAAFAIAAGFCGFIASFVFLRLLFFSFKPRSF